MYHLELLLSVYGLLTLDVEWHYIESVTATAHQEKGIITPFAVLFSVLFAILLLTINVYCTQKV